VSGRRSSARTRGARDKNARARAHMYAHPMLPSYVAMLSWALSQADTCTGKHMHTLFHRQTHAHSLSQANTCTLSFTGKHMHTLFHRQTHAHSLSQANTCTGKHMQTHAHSLSLPFLSSSRSFALFLPPPTHRCRTQKMAVGGMSE
jgi:hypothetical protein